MHAICSCTRSTIPSRTLDASSLTAAVLCLSVSQSEDRPYHATTAGRRHAPASICA